MGVMLELRPGEARQLDGFPKIVDGRNTQIGAGTIGRRRVAMSPIGSATEPQAEWRRFKLHQVSDTRVQKAVSVKLPRRIVW